MDEEMMASSEIPSQSARAFPLLVFLLVDHSTYVSYHYLWFMYFCQLP